MKTSPKEMILKLRKFAHVYVATNICVGGGFVEVQKPEVKFILENMVEGEIVNYHHAEDMLWLTPIHHFYR